jgi:hypothetical protein
MCLDTMRLRTWTSFRPRLLYPIEPAPRVAVIGRHVKPERNVTVFAEHDEDAIGQFGAQALAACVPVLRRLAIRRLSVTHAIIAFTSEDDPLSQADRDLFWTTFQVPVFEQRLTPEGELAAWECEAHGPLHKAGARGGERCACGREAVLLRPVDSLSGGILTGC